MKTPKEMSNEELLYDLMVYGSMELDTEVLRRLESEANLRRAVAELAKNWTDKATAVNSIDPKDSCRATTLALCAVELTAILRGSSGSIPAVVVTST